MAMKVGMYSAAHENVTEPVGRDWKIRTALRTNQIAGFVTARSEKKTNCLIHYSNVVATSYLA